MIARMNERPGVDGSSSIDAIAYIVEALAERGFAVVRDALPAGLIVALRERAHALDAAGELAPAKVGHGDRTTEARAIRGDRIAWLSESPATEAEAWLARWLDTLRIACNRALMLGLADFEGHYASYPPGAGYARHRDRFRDDDTRVLSCVAYLNDSWHERDGGVLRLYVEGGEAVDIVPAGGTFVAFLSGDFDHEVLPATRERIAVAGWFRRRRIASTA